MTNKDKKRISMSFISNSIATKAEIKDVIKDIVSFIAIQRVNKEMINIDINKGAMSLEIVFLMKCKPPGTLCPLETKKNA